MRINKVVNNTYFCIIWLCILYTFLLTDVPLLYFLGFFIGFNVLEFIIRNNFLFNERQIESLSMTVYTLGAISLCIIINSSYIQINKKILLYMRLGHLKAYYIWDLIFLYLLRFRYPLNNNSLILAIHHIITVFITDYMLGITQDKHTSEYITGYTIMIIFTLIEISHIIHCLYHASKVFFNVNPSKYWIYIDMFMWIIFRPFIYIYAILHEEIFNIVKGSLVIFILEDLYWGYKMYKQLNKDCRISNTR